MSVDLESLANGSEGLVKNHYSRVVEEEKEKERELKRGAERIEAFATVTGVSGVLNERKSKDVLEDYEGFWADHFTACAFGS